MRLRVRRATAFDPTPLASTPLASTPLDPATLDPTPLDPIPLASIRPLDNADGPGSGDRYHTSNDFQSKSVVTAQINGGTKRDVILAVSGADAGGPFRAVHVMLGQGDGTLERDGNGNPVFRDFYSYPAGQPNSVGEIEAVITVDLNGNGFPDIVTSHNQPNKISVLLNRSLEDALGG